MTEVFKASKNSFSLHLAIDDQQRDYIYFILQVFLFI
jgi:hypothetical protein